MSFRSMTDEQMLEKYGYDPAPWRDIENDERYSEADHDGSPSTMQVFDPRPEFIPTFRTYELRSREPKEVLVMPRPEPNPILAAFREDRATCDLDHGTPECAELFLNWDIDTIEATPEHVEHARKVLTRLAAFA